MANTFDFPLDSFIISYFPFINHFRLYYIILILKCKKYYLI